MINELMSVMLYRFGKNDYSSDNQPIPMKSNREEPPLRDLRSADLCTLPTSVVTPSIQLKESKQPLTDSGHGSAEDGPDTPDIQSVTVTELPPTKAITHSHPQAPKVRRKKQIPAEQILISLMYNCEKEYTYNVLVLHTDANEQS